MVSQAVEILLHYAHHVLTLNQTTSQHLKSLVSLWRRYRYPEDQSDYWPRRYPVGDSIVGEVQQASTDAWLKKSVDLTPFKNQIVKLLFTAIEGAAGSDQDLAIDDLTIFEV